jgi:simple sugar transport system permease protein
VLLGMVNDVLVLRNTSTFWIDAVNGAIILIALALARAIGFVRT